MPSSGIVHAQVTFTGIPSGPVKVATVIAVVSQSENGIVIITFWLPCGTIVPLLRFTVAPLLVVAVQFRFRIVLMAGLVNVTVQFDTVMAASKLHGLWLASRLGGLIPSGGCTTLHTH